MSKNATTNTKKQEAEQKSESTETVVRVRTKELTAQVQEISDVTKKLRVIVDALPSSSVKDAYELSVANLEKKNDRFLNTAVVLTPEQKRAIDLIRQGKIDVSKISALVGEKPSGRKV